MRTVALIFLYGAALVGGTYLTFRPTFDSHFAFMQTERGDGLLNHYLLENSWLAVSDHPAMDSTTENGWPSRVRGKPSSSPRCRFVRTTGQ